MTIYSRVHHLTLTKGLSKTSADLTSHCRESLTLPPAIFHHQTPSSPPSRLTTVKVTQVTRQETVSYKHSNTKPVTAGNRMKTTASLDGRIRHTAFGTVPLSGGHCGSLQSSAPGSWVRSFCVICDARIVVNRNTKADLRLLLLRV